MGGECRTQVFIPALVLVVYEGVSLAGNHIALLDQGEAIGARFRVTIFDLLYQPGHANFEKLVEIAGRDGKKLQPLKQRVFVVLSFFEDAAIEGKPGGFSIDVIGRIIEREA